MDDHRLEYYDPLYETITFERGLPSRRGFMRLPEDPLHPVDLVQTADFARLAFLRQAGFAWLVFPSAAHTRFSHSIGCWWLGRIAETHIRVRGAITAEDTDSEIRSLQKWLETTGLREEFYLSLLFHDIGHGPFSYVLERNMEFRGGLVDAGLPVNRTGHDFRGAALIEGQGVLAATWRDRAKWRYGKDVRTIGDVMSSITAQASNRICIPAILYLITSDEEYLSRCKCEHRRYLPVLHELVSGILDLDRLDHYARDSYFSGLRHVAINVRGFLNNLCISYQGKAVESIHLSLTRDGASHAASLLFGKRQIISTMFKKPDTMAFQAMGSWALSRYLLEHASKEERGRAALEIALMEDGHFLETLSSSRVEACKYLVQRIRSLKPYSLVGRWQKDNIGVVGQDQLRQRLSKFDASCSQHDPPEILLHFDDDFWDARVRMQRDWLDSGGLLLEEKLPLIKHPDFADSFAHLRSLSQSKNVWVFAKNIEKSEWARQEISKILELGGG